MDGTQTNWYIITGGPSAGKSKTLEQLAFLGHNVVPEAARMLIDEEFSKGKDIYQVRKDELAFQEKILQLKLEAEAKLDPNQLTFIDRGIADSFPYFSLAGADTDRILDLSQRNIYKGIFLLDQVTFEKDYARQTEDAELANRISDLLSHAYTQLGYEFVRVPVMPISERVDFILAHIKAEPRTIEIGLSD
jgi:predicted ATPase